MVLENNGGAEKLGRDLGYAFGYLLFTTSMFFILSFTGRLPHGFGYLHVAGITLLITCAGFVFRRLLQ